MDSPRRDTSSALPPVRAAMQKLPSEPSFERALCTSSFLLETSTCDAKVAVKMAPRWFQSIGKILRAMGQPDLRTGLEMRQSLDAFCAFARARLYRVYSGYQGSWGGVGETRPMVRGVCPLDFGSVTRDYGSGSTTA